MHFDVHKSGNLARVNVYIRDKNEIEDMVILIAEYFYKNIFIELNYNSISKNDKIIFDMIISSINSCFYTL